MRRRAQLYDLLFDKPGAHPAKLAAARWMRAKPTAAEAELWSALRGRQLCGWKFRRQHVIAGYIVDFYCAQLRLALEVDGGVHRGRRADDRERQERLASVGVRVVRLRNVDVLERLDDVLNEVVHHCEQRAAQLIPPPLRGGGIRGSTA
jgi:very-short-patch-repair endonuclease